jgi:hypothetical protein
MEAKTQLSKTVNGHRVKENGYNSATLHAKRKRKREEAEVRQEEHDKLTSEQKIAKAVRRPGGSKKEIARLQKVYTQEQAAREAKRTATRQNLEDEKAGAQVRAKRK